MDLGWIQDGFRMDYDGFRMDSGWIYDGFMMD